jgi:hypothetical protein
MCNGLILKCNKVPELYDVEVNIIAYQLAPAQAIVIGQTTPLVCGLVGNVLETTMKRPERAA